MRRQRLSWNRKAKTSSRDMRRRRRANSELPTGEPASPAYNGQPPFDKYEKGDTSAWAEDVHEGPYGNGEHPATPDEGPASPAYKAAALERKAAKCIRIAQAQLGRTASVSDVEERAVELMDLSNRQIQAKLRTASKEEMEEEMEESTEMEESKKKASLMRRLSFLERKLTRLAKDEEMEEEMEEDMEESKKKASLMRRLSFLERKLARLAKEDKEEKEDHEKGAIADDKDHIEKLEKDEKEDKKDLKKEESKKKAFLRSLIAMKSRLSSWEMMEDEEMEELLEMMEENTSHEEAMSPEFAEEHMMGKPSEEMMEDSMDAGIALMEEPMEDPMGVMDEAVSEQEMMILSKLFGEKSAEDKEKKKEDEEKAEAEAAETIQEEVEEKAKEKKEESKKKAKLRPQPKKASTGATRLGGVTKEASSEISDLSKLWSSAPDVSKFF